MGFQEHYMGLCSHFFKFWGFKFSTGKDVDETKTSVKSISKARIYTLYSAKSLTGKDVTHDAGLHFIMKSASSHLESSNIQVAMNTSTDVLTECSIVEGVFKVCSNRNVSKLQSQRKCNHGK